MNNGMHDLLPDVRAEKNEAATPVSSGRRKFMGNVGGAMAWAIAGGGFGLPAIVVSGRAEAAEIGPLLGNRRLNSSFRVRVDAALAERNLPVPAHPTNSDELSYASKVNNFTKALPHNALGEVDPSAYNAMIGAISTGDYASFEAIPMGGTAKLVNPMGSKAYSLEGADSHQLTIAVPPALNSEAAAAEMTELYWMALARDVPFSQYGAETITASAIADLSTFSLFGGISPSSLFRGPTAGDQAGPYLSQFLLKDIPYGAATTLVQQYKTSAAGQAFMTDFNEWLSIQNGNAPSAAQIKDPALLYIRNGRDLAEFVHGDFSYQAFLNAALILLGMGGSAIDDASPYKSSAKQAAFLTFGGPYILDLVARVALYALKAAWFQKWNVHRKARPEAYGGMLHNVKTGASSYSVNSKLLNSPALSLVLSQYGTYLLPQAYPEGSPAHPSFPAGHAVISGACVTVLKAVFKESFVIPNAIVASDDGFSLLSYTATPLTIGGELNKLASNVAIGRNFGGIHYWSDGVEGMKLGEAVAIRMLNNMQALNVESIGGFTLTKFDGTTVTVGAPT